MSSPSIVPRILENLCIIAASVTTLDEVNQLDRALHALKTRFDLIGPDTQGVREAFTQAQDRINKAKRPVIDDLTKFRVMRRKCGHADWELYNGNSSWETAYTICMDARQHQSGEFNIVVWL